MLPNPRVPAGVPAVLAVLALAASAAAPEAVAAQGPLAVGDRAPSFPSALPSTAGERPGAKTIALEEVLGRKNIVLAFYVADWTGG